MGGGGGGEGCGVNPWHNQGMSVLSLPVVSLPRFIGVASNPPAATFGPRVLLDYEFVWMIEGEATYRRGHEQIAVPRGSVVLCRPTQGDERDAFDWDRRRRSRHGYVHFDVAELPAGFPPPEDWPWTRALADGDIWRPLFLHLRTLASLPAEAGTEPLARQALGYLLAIFVRGHTAAGPLPAPDWPEPVRAATRHYTTKLEADPSAKVTLGELAEAACVTRAYLCRAFKRSTGRAPLAAVREHRLDRALAMLTRSNEPVAQVALACGFASPFHFSRRFKEAFGSSPTDLRHDVQTGQTPPLPLGHVWGTPPPHHSH